MKRFMMSVITMLVCGAGSVALAQSQPPIPGKTFFRSQNQIVTQDAQIEFPLDANGQVNLIIADKRTPSYTFRTLQRYGRVIFEAVFVLPPETPQGYSTALVYTGSYMRETNMAIYFGDVYRSTLMYPTSKQTIWQDINMNLQHTGGFEFRTLPVDKTLPLPTDPL